MTKQQQIAAFLDKHVTLPRMVSPYWAHQGHSLMQPRPTVEQVANELLQLAEFRVLRLGTWLGTVDGQVLTEAVEMVAPPFYRQDIELLVAGLKLAAEMQSKGERKAGAVALGVVGVAGLIAWGLGEGGIGSAA